MADTNKQAPPQNVPMPGRRGPRGPMIVEKPKEGKKTLTRLVRYFEKEKGMVAGLLGIVVVLVVCSVYAPKLQSEAIDKITDGAFRELPSVLLVMLILYGISGVSTLIQSLLSAQLSQRIVKRMREDLFDKIVNLPIKYLDTHPHGDIMSRMTNDVENISGTVSQSLSS